jgi:hypothetical protein
MSKCYSGNDLNKDINEFISAEVEPFILSVTKYAAERAYYHVTTIPVTWSVYNDKPYWTQNFWWSNSISINNIVNSPLPKLKTPWPNAGITYNSEDARMGLEVLAGLLPYELVYISNSTSHVQDVENHTNIYDLSYELTLNEVNSSDLNKFSSGPAIPF